MFPIGNIAFCLLPQLCILFWEIRPDISSKRPSRNNAIGFLRSAAASVLCRKDRLFEQRSKNLTAFRLPLRHEMGERAGGEVVLRAQGAKRFLQSTASAAVRCAPHRTRACEKTRNGGLLSRARVSREAQLTAPEGRAPPFQQLHSSGLEGFQSLKISLSFDDR
jgi:hypothetical protein